MTADCGIRGDAKKEMQSCWTYVKCRSRPAKSCKGSEPRKRSDSRFTLLYAILPTLYRSQGFRSVLVKENLRFQFSRPPDWLGQRRPQSRKFGGLFCLTAVTLRLEAMVRKLGQGIEP